MGIQIATPYSTLFDNERDKKMILDLSDAVELRRPGQAQGALGPFLYHCELSMVARWPEDERAALEALAKKVRLEAVSFHVLSRYEKNEIRNNAFFGLGEPYTESEMLDNAAKNVNFARRVFGANVPLLVENNNHLGTDAYDMVTDPAFLAQIMEANDLGLLWDIAHAKISTINRKVGLDQYLSGLPLENTVQIHLARHGVRDGVAFDAHEALEGEDWAFFEDWLPRLPKLKYATIEYYKDAATLVGQLKRLRLILDGATGS